VGKVLKRFKYSSRCKSERSLLFAYIQRLSGYSSSHLARLISLYRETQNLAPRSRASRTSFSRRFTEVDISLRGGALWRGVISEVIILTGKPRGKDLISKATFLNCGAALPLHHAFRKALLVRPALVMGKGA
jgi:hypothetical protein